MTCSAETLQSDGAQDEDLQDEFLGALAALGGSTGNGRLREVLEWSDTTFDTVRAQLLSRGLVVPGRGRGGSVGLADGDGTPAAPARRTRAARGSGTTTASSFEQPFRAIDDCLRKEAGCGTELDDTEQTSWLLFLRFGDDLRDFVNQRLFSLPGAVQGVLPFSGSPPYGQPAFCRAVDHSVITG